MIVTVWMEKSSGRDFQGLTSTRFQLSAATGPESSGMFCGRLLCIGSAAANTPAVNGSFCWPLAGEKAVIQTAAANKKLIQGTGSAPAGKAGFFCARAVVCVFCALQFQLVP